MRLTLLGTGDARQVPVYGCDCPACRNARADAGLRRRPCSALLECAGQRWLIDSGLVDLCERFPPHSLDGILQTHYHADHAQGLLHLRWGQGLVIPVHGPADPEGLADLYKHPGILDFSQPFGAFERRQWGALAATALPLVHSKPTFGYLLEGASEEGTIRRLAYLTDTVGLPADSASRLLAAPLDLLVLDCSMPPQEQPPRNHNDLTRALECIDSLRPRRAVLTHVGHTLDAWLLDHPAALPEGGGTGTRRHVPAAVAPGKALWAKSVQAWIEADSPTYHQCKQQPCAGNAQQTPGAPGEEGGLGRQAQRQDRAGDHYEQKNDGGS
ncbi:carbon-phosphorus lyase complex accessory protein [Pseudomonas aeruginosa]|nr:carbon-phosphorus lyase complex accessory protein [Pseudomonas aeruginosa]